MLWYVYKWLLYFGPTSSFPGASVSAVKAIKILEVKLTLDRVIFCHGVLTPKLSTHSTPRKPSITVRIAQLSVTASLANSSSLLPMLGQ